jgi:hypothetical protein
MVYETQSRIRKLLSEFLIGMKFPEVFRCSWKTVSDDRVFRQKFIAAFKESVSAIQRFGLYFCKFLLLFNALLNRFS